LSSLTLLTVTAATARADSSDVITVNSVSSPNDQLGSLSVDVTSTTPVTSLAAHVLNSGTQADALDPAMSQASSTYTDWSQTYESVWTVTTPVTTAQLPAGDYAVTVDAADQGGASVTGASAGTWQYTSVPVITASADRTRIDYGHPTANITGTVRLHNPDGTTTPYQGPVVVVESWASTVTFQSDPAGNFSFPASPLYAGGSEVYLLANVQQTSGNRWGQFPMDFSVTQDPAKITAAVSPSQVPWGAQASITGTVSYQPAGQSGYLPATAAPVSISVFKSDNYTSVPDATGMTDATGHFSIPLPQNPGATWIVAGGTGTANVMLQLGQADVTEVVAFNTTITSFTTSLNQHWGITFAGCAGLPASVPNASRPPASALKLQWSAGKNGPWHNLARAITSGGPCGHNGLRFSGTALAPVNYAYYRVYFPGTPADSIYHEGFHSSASSPVLAWKYADRITGLSVAPTTVSANGKITVKGTLQYYDSGWRSYGSGHTIMIVLKPAGSSTWYWIVKVSTNAKGQFSATFKDPVSATWAAYFDGNSTHLSVQSGGVYVTVR
jgi:hypothetical protein